MLYHTRYIFVLNHILSTDIREQKKNTKIKFNKSFNIKL